MSITSKDILNQKLTLREDVTAGSYPATVYGVGEPKTIPSQFHPGARLVFEVNVAIRTKTGTVQRVGYLLPVGEGGVHKRSNMYKMLAALGASDKELEGGSAFGDYLGRSCLATIEINEKGFPKVTGFAPAVDGLKYPTAEECARLVEDAEDPWDGPIK